MDPSKLSPATLIDGGIVGTKVASRAVSGKAAAIVVGAARRKSVGAQAILSAREVARQPANRRLPMVASLAHLRSNKPAAALS